MLKKFKNFFHPIENKIDMSFSPFIISIDGKRMQVMQATDDNIPDLLILEKQVYSGSTPWSSFSFKTELAKRKNSLYLVVYYESILVAFIGARFHPRETHITNIAVTPEFQRKSIATYLMNFIIDKARNNGSEAVSLEVRVDNKGAQSLYRKLGFKPTFVRKNYYQDNTDAINMILWLAPHRVNS